MSGGDVLSVGELDFGDRKGQAKVNNFLASLKDGEHLATFWLQPIQMYTLQLGIHYFYFYFMVDGGGVERYLAFQDGGSIKKVENY